MPSKNILILLVNYYNETEVCAFVREQIFSRPRENTAVVIVDNGSKEPGRMAQLAAEMPYVQVATPGNNLGYLPGASFGLRKYLENSSGLPDIIILSNSDIEFADPHLLEELVSGDPRDRYDMLGPDIWSGLLHNSQNPFMRQRITLQKLNMLAFLSSNAAIHYLFLTFFYTRLWILSKFRRKLAEHREIVPVYGIHGAFMIFNRSFFEKGGNLDFPLQLFGEEIWLAELALASGMLVGYDPRLRIIHHEHKTTGIFESRWSIKLMHRSYRYLAGQRNKLNPNNP